MSIRECLPNMMILVSVFGNPGLFRPHPLRENTQALGNRWAGNKSPRSRIGATGAPVLFLPVAGSWVTHTEVPNICGG